jgi:Holliday junction resolvase
LNNYARGANFERDVKRDLEGKGYFAIRSAGSHGAVDIVAFGPKHPVWFIQAKIHGTMSPAERKELYRFANECGAWAVRASRPKRGEILYERLFTHGKEQWVEIFA